MARRRGVTVERGAFVADVKDSGSFKKSGFYKGNHKKNRHCEMVGLLDGHQSRQHTTVVYTRKSVVVCRWPC